MNTLVHADLFFFITSIAVIVFASACLVLVIYLIIVARDVMFIVRMIKNQAISMRDDIEHFRASIRNISVKDWIRSFTGGVRKSKKKVAEE
jgi:hypothetical protein